MLRENKQQQMTEISSEHDLSGHWVCRAQYQSGVTGRGELQERTLQYEISIQIIQEGQIIKGMYLGASGGMCGKATLNGNISGDNVQWHIKYIDCADIEKQFNGSVIFKKGAMKIEGETHPINTPSNAPAFSAYETLVMLRQSNRDFSGDRDWRSRISDSIGMRVPLFPGFSIDLKSLLKKR